MPSSVDSAARTAASSPVFRALARSGYVANGAVHLLLGVVILVVSFGGAGESDQSGAFQAVADAPFGVIGLWVIAIALWALGAWQAVQAYLERHDGMGSVIGDAAKAIAFVSVGVVAVSIALGSRSSGEEGTEQASGGLLALPGGPFLLGAIGLVIAGIGIAFIVIGARRRFRKKVTLPAGPTGRAVLILGVVGYIAKGIALGIVGVLAVIAAVRLDPQTAGGLDGAIRALLALPAGPFLGAAVGIGLLAYGVFTVLRARYVRLEA
jgi:hypothetical protein